MWDLGRTETSDNNLVSYFALISPPPSKQNCLSRGRVHHSFQIVHSCTLLLKTPPGSSPRLVWEATLGNLAGCLSVSLFFSRAASTKTVGGHTCVQGVSFGRWNLGHAFLLLKLIVFFSYEKGACTNCNVLK